MLKEAVQVAQLVCIFLRLQQYKVESVLQLSDCRSLSDYRGNPSRRVIDMEHIFSL